MVCRHRLDPDVSEHGPRLDWHEVPRRLLIYRRRMNAQFSTFRSDCLRAPQVTSEDENDPPSKPARRPW